MNAQTKVFLSTAVLATVLAGVFANVQFALARSGATASITDDIGFTNKFFLEDCHFSSIGSNRFFILEPDYRLVLSGEKDGVKGQLTITVTEETKKVDGIQTRVVEERHVEDGELVELSRNYFAICEQTNSVFYFGEDTDNYEGGKIVNHDGSWLAGKSNAKAGLVMPGIVLLGSRYQQETAPGVAMDRAQIVSISEVVDTAAGKFKDVLKTQETTPLEPGVVEYKYYAAGIGLIQDQELKLQK